MALINPYINFNGNSEEAFVFYKSIFGGEFAQVTRFEDLSSPEFPVAEHEANKIMHIALPIGRNVLMGNDVPEYMGRVNENENRSKIAVSAESREEADKLFSGLSAGGNIEVPIGQSPWGSYFGCSEISMVLNGRWILTPNITAKYKRETLISLNKVYPCQGGYING